MAGPVPQPDQATLSEPVSPPPPAFPDPYAHSQQQQQPPTAWFAPPPNPYADVETMRRVAAEQKSFTTPAIITFVLYWVLWLPGLIANLVYLSEARGIKRVTGRDPEGLGCLWALLIVFIALPVVGFCVWLAILAAAASSNG